MVDEKGFYHKYNIQKTDGSPIDPNARYIVLRYDKDDDYGEVTRYLLLIFCRLIKPFAKKFSLDLQNEILKELSKIGKTRQVQKTMLNSEFGFNSNLKKDCYNSKCKYYIITKYGRECEPDCKNIKHSPS